MLEWVRSTTACSITTTLRSAHKFQKKLTACAPATMRISERARTAIPHPPLYNKSARSDDGGVVGVVEVGSGWQKGGACGVWGGAGWKGEGRRGDAQARTQSPEKHGDRAKSKRGGRERGDVPRRCS